MQVGFFWGALSSLLFIYSCSHGSLILLKDFVLRGAPFYKAELEELSRFLSQNGCIWFWLRNNRD